MPEICRGIKFFCVRAPAPDDVETVIKGHSLQSHVAGNSDINTELLAVLFRRSGIPRISCPSGQARPFTDDIAGRTFEEIAMPGTEIGYGVRQ